ncbi:hypothetical protein D3C85_1227180 [compost metagenome]
MEERQPPTIDHIHAFHPDLHEAWSGDTDIPIVIGQSGAALAGGAAGQGEDGEGKQHSLHSGYPACGLLLKMSRWLGAGLLTSTPLLGVQWAARLPGAIGDAVLFDVGRRFRLE